MLFPASAAKSACCCDESAEGHAASPVAHSRGPVHFHPAARYGPAHHVDHDATATREARQPGGFSGGIATLAEGKLYALQNPYKLDGRVSSYPASARGYSVANCYLLKQPDAAMLIDTGFGKDEQLIISQVESLIAPKSPLSLFPLRLNEFMSINNVETFAGHFNIETCYTSNPDAALWFDFGAKADGRSILDSMPVTAVTRSDTIKLGKQGREIDVMQAPIRLIATRWLYDRRHQDAVLVRHVHPCLARAHRRTVDRHRRDRHGDRARDAIVHAQHALLVAGRRADRLMRRGIADVFDKYDVETIAPGYGCILRGREVVARHYKMLDEF